MSIDTHEHEQIDDTLRTYLAFVSQFKGTFAAVSRRVSYRILIVCSGEYLTTDYDVLRCAYRLHRAPVFQNEQEYVRTQLLYCVLQEESVDVLHIITAFLLHDGRQNEVVFETLNEEGGFARILELIQTVQEESLHRQLLELMYEMSRIQRVKPHDLALIDDDFILYLLRITEGLSADVNDPYHYYVIRVLVSGEVEHVLAAADLDEACVE